MNTVATTSTIAQHAEMPVAMTAVAALEKDPRWISANDAQRVVLKRIAMQRDRLSAAKQAHQQTKELQTPVESVPADAPFVERLTVFAKLHPVATAAAAGAALLIGPRKLIRYGGLALPFLSKFMR